MNNIYLDLDEVSKENGDLEVLRSALYTTKRRMQANGSKGDEVDVMAGPDAARALYKMVRKFYEKSFGKLINLPEEPELKPIAIGDRRLFTFFQCHFPHESVRMNIVINETLGEHWPNMLAIMNWLEI